MCKLLTFRDTSITISSLRSESSSIFSLVAPVFMLWLLTTVPGYLIMSMILLNCKTRAFKVPLKLRIMTKCRAPCSTAVACPAAAGVEEAAVDNSNLYPNFSFNVLKKDSKSKARLGVIHTPHGDVQTPNFVFCATRGAMKSISPDQLRAEGAQIMLSNTYHMMLSPGPEIVAQNGGLQKFTAWRGPMLTDSGGYQIFSMGHGCVSHEIKGNRSTDAPEKSSLIKIDEEGAVFRSYVDGSVEKLSPERSIDTQRQLGADLIVVLDECTPFHVDKEYTAASMRRSHRWALRSLAEFKRTNTHKQALYGIVQGGVHLDLRDEGTDFINRHNFFGVAIGGSLGDTKRTMHDIVTYTRAKLRDDRPVHLLGIGGVIDIFHGVRQGIDTFDCVSPTRLARHGGCLVPAAHWSEEIHPAVLTACSQRILDTATNRANKIREKNKAREISLRHKFGLTSSSDLAAVDQDAALKQLESELLNDPGAQKLAAERKKVDDELAARLAAEKTRLQKRTVSDHIKIRSGLMRNDPRPIDSTCSCYTCKNFSRAYLHHCFVRGEQLGATLVSRCVSHICVVAVCLCRF